MKFVSAFSTGKDSMLALHRMVAAGHTPVGLIVMYNSGAQRSWFHGADKALLNALSDSLNIPLICCETDGSDYNEKFESALAHGQALGAEACVFGDIDIAEHRQWDEDRCKQAGMPAVLPLWNEPREALVRETVRAGYKCLIKCVNASKLPESFLGRILDDSVLDEMQGFGIDLCGENGEYHTIVVDGPLLRRPVPYKPGNVAKLEYVSAIEITV